MSQLLRGVVGALGLSLILTQSGWATVVTSSTFSGNVGVEVAAYPCAGSPCAGTLTLSTLPAGATILDATLYGNNYFASPSVSATFAGTPLGAVTPFDTHLGFSTYQWDVTGLITGNASYGASFAGATNTYGLALVVAFSDPSLPLGTVFVNDGAFDINGGAGGSFSTTFSGAGAGSGTLWIHTAADNNGFGQTGEQILFNGGVVGSPIDANLGSFASLLQLPVTVLGGTDTAQINAASDQLGWDLAVLHAGPTQVRVPLPATLLLLGGGLLALGMARRRG